MREMLTTIINKVRKNSVLAAFVLLATITFSIFFSFANAEAKIEVTEELPCYTNAETGYKAYIVDMAQYLTEEEESKLLQEMQAITQYCNVAYYTEEGNESKSESYSADRSKAVLCDLFGHNTAIIYTVDNAYDYIYAQEEAYRVITSGKAYSITDNVYHFSSEERYYEGAHEAFSEMLTLFEGGKITEPMRYICNALLAIIMALFINYLIVSSKSKLKRASNEEMVKGAVGMTNVGATNVEFVNTTKRYSPRSKSSGGGGGGGHSGGGGGHAH